jgi:hypothetical protein
LPIVGCDNYPAVTQVPVSLHKCASQ